MTTQGQIHTESDFLQAHLTALDAQSSWMGSFNQVLMEVLKRWASRIFVVLRYCEWREHRQRGGDVGVSVWTTIQGDIDDRIRTASH
jgi:hypothetical protein